MGGGGTESLANGLKEIGIGMLYASGSRMINPDNILPIGAIWFLWALFWTELILFIGEKYNEIVLGITSLALAFIASLTAKIFWLPLSIQAGMFALPYLVAGKYFKRYYQNIRNNRILMYSLSVLSIVGYVLMVFNYKGTYIVNCDYGHGIIDYVGTFLCVWFVGVVSVLVTKISALSKVLQWYGRNSLLFLAIHNLELSVFPYSAVIKKCFCLIGIDSPTEFLSNTILILSKFVLITIAMFVMMKSKKIKRIFRCS